MTKADREIRDLKKRIEDWLRRVNDHNVERTALKIEKRKLLKELNELEKKYGDS